jgi:hypothetical protein
MFLFAFAKVIIPAHGSWYMRNLYNRQRHRDEFSTYTSYLTFLGFRNIIFYL